VGAVNCEKDKKFCQGVGVSSYPTLALFTSNDAGLVEFYPRNTAKTPEKIEQWARDKAEEWRWLLEAGVCEGGVGHGVGGFVLSFCFLNHFYFFRVQGHRHF